MAFPDLVNFPEELSLYTPMICGLGISPATFQVKYPTTDIPVAWPKDSFLYLAFTDKPFLTAFNGTVSKPGLVSNLKLNLHPNLTAVINTNATLNAILTGFNTGETVRVVPGLKRLREKMFTVQGNISSANVITLEALTSIKSPVISSTQLTSLSVFSDHISATFIEFLSGQFNHISGTDALITNISSAEISSFNVQAVNLTAKRGIVPVLSSTIINTDNQIIKFDLNSDTIHVRDLFISGTCTGCPTGPGGPGGPGTGGSSVFNGVTADHIVIINKDTTIPAFRVTQYGDQPLAIFFDVTGHPERNFKLLASGGVDIPGTAGEAFTIGLTEDNYLVRMGSNSYGQLATTTNPVIAAETTSFKFNKISAKGATVLGLSADGSVYAWGYNIDGQVGDGTTVNTSTPVCVLQNPSVPGIPIITISAGSNHSAAVSQNGTLYTWGSNSSGQLGQGLDNIALPNKKEPTALTETSFLKVECGGQHTLAIKTDGSLWAWGNNSQGQLGDGTFIDKLVPTLIDNTRIYTSISCGVSHSAAIDSDNRLFIWGSNGYSQLGTGSTVDSNVPVNIGTFSKVSCGFFHTIALAPVGGEIYGWGRNHKKQVANSSNDTITVPTLIGAGTYTSVFAGKDNTFAVDAGGSTIGWGNNENHQLGFTTDIVVSSPTTLLKGQTSGINVAMIIDGSEEAPGFVGINTSTPNKQLTVKGDISSSDTFYGNISASKGFVGLLTSTDAKIDVAGITSAQIGTLSSTNITSITVSAANLSATRGSIDFLKSTSLTSTNGLIDNLSSVNIRATAAVLTSLNTNSVITNSLSASTLTANTGRFDTDLTIVRDLSVGGTIDGNIIGKITTTTAVLTSLTANNIFATDVLGVGLTGSNMLDIITAANAQLFVSGNTVITDSLSVMGSAMQVDAKSFFTSGVRISNPHTETSLIVSQSGGLPVAEFYYTHAPWEIDQIALFVDGYAFRDDVPVSKYRGGYVGVRTKTPNEALTVRGNISASGDITTATGSMTVANLKAATISATSVSGVSGFFDFFQIPNLTLTGDLRSNTLKVDTTAVVDTLTARTATITDSLSVSNLVEAALFKGAISATSANLVSLTSVNSELVKVSSHDLFSDIGNFTYLSAISADINDLNTVNFTANSLSAGLISAITLSATTGDFLSDVNIGGSLVVKVDSTVEGDTTIFGDVSINGDVTIDEGITVGGDGVYSGGLTVANNLSVNSDLYVANDLFVGNDIRARRFLGEVIGPTVSIGTSADLISLSAQTARINDLKADLLSATNLIALTANIGYLEKLNTNVGYVSSLTAADIKTDTITALSAFISDGYVNLTELTATSAFFPELTATLADINFLVKLNTNTGFVSSLTSEEIFSDFISATEVKIDSLTALNLQSNNLSSRSLILDNEDAATNLIIRQRGVQNLVEFYYRPTCTAFTPLLPAFVIKGSGCPLDHGGFVGIRIDDPQEALTVNGNISSSGFAVFDGVVGIGTFTPRSKLEVIGKIWGTSLEVIEEVKADVVRANSVVATNVTAETVDATTVNAVAVNVSTDLSVGGKIFGTLEGTFNGVGVSTFEQLSCTSLTSTFVRSDTISATKIFVPGGNSDKWNDAYGVPTTINIVINGGGEPIEPGTKNWIEIPYDIQLSSWTLYADIPSTNSVAVTVLSSDFNSYPVNAPIFSTPPTLLGGTVKNRQTDLSTWSNTLLSGTVLVFGVSTVDLPGGPATIETTLMTLCLRGTRI
jgi:alpha-tubulin suppressor-like RCC1 family protein